MSAKFVFRRRRFVLSAFVFALALISVWKIVSTSEAGKSSAVLVPSITATKTDAIATDVDSDGRADPGDTLKYTVTINNSGTDATGVIFQDILSSNLSLVAGSVNASPIANNDTFSVYGNVSISVLDGASDLLSNDIDPDTGNNTGLTATVETKKSAQCVIAACPTDNVTISANGSFTYDPPVGFTGADTFTYTTNDGNSTTNTATVTLNVSGMIWFVNNSAAACTTLAAQCGKFSKPFSTLDAFNAVNDSAAGHPGANSDVFIYQSATGYTLSSGLLMRAGERFIGQDASPTATVISNPALFNITLPANSATLPSTDTGGATVAISGNTITAVSNNTLRGVTLGNAATLTGSGFGTLTVADVIINTNNAQALNLTNGTIAGAGFISVTSTGGTNNVALTTVAGTLALGSGALSGASGTAFVVSGGTAAITYGGTISKTSAGQIVNIGTHATGNITLSGNLTCNAGCTGINATGNTSGTIDFSGAAKTLNTGANAAVTLATNTGATISFTNGGLDIDTTSGTGFSATGGGTVTVTTGTNANTIDSTTGTALNVVSTNIGASGLTFRSISANGAASGIVLNNTGSSGGLTVTGNGGGCTIATQTCDGGSIQNSTGAGISLTTASKVSLTRMKIQSGGNDGISGTSVTGFTLANSILTSNGNADEEHGIEFANLLGTAVISDTVVRGSFEHNLKITNTSGTLDSLNIKNSTFDHATVPVSPAGGNGVLIVTQGTSVITNGSINNCTFRNNFSNGVLVNTENNSRIGDDNATGSSMNGFRMANSTFDDNNIAIQFGVFNGSDMTVDIQGNSIINDNRVATSGPGSTSQAMVVGSSAIAQAGSTLNARIDSNIIGSSAIAGSGSSIGSGIRTIVQGLTDSTILINNNTIHQTPNGFGMELNNLGPQDDLGTVPVSDITVTNNTVSDHYNIAFSPGSSNYPLPAIYLNADNQALAAGAPTVRANVTGNIVPTSVGGGNLCGTGSCNFTGAWLEVFEYNGSSPGILQLVDVTPASANATAELQSHNTGSALAGGGTIDLIPGPITTPPDLTPLAMLEPMFKHLTTPGTISNEVIAKIFVAGEAEATVEGNQTIDADVIKTSYLAYVSTFFSDNAKFLAEAADKLDSMISPTVTAQELRRDSAKKQNRGDLQAAAPQAGETICVDGNTNAATCTGGFTLPAGKTITITFNATIANNPPLPSPALTSVSNQGSVSGSNFSTVTTNTDVRQIDSTTVAVASNPNPSVFGQSVTLTATLTGAPARASDPTGTVQFKADGTNIGSPVVVLIGTAGDNTSTAQASIASLSVGNHVVTAEYSGGGSGATGYNANIGTLSGGQSVNKANSSVGLTSSANPSVAAQTVTFTATIAAVAPGAGTPTGSVQFLDNGSSITGCASVTLISAQAQCAVNTLSIGSHTITANYLGDGNFNISTGNLTGNPQVVNKAATVYVDDTFAGSSDAQDLGSGKLFNRNAFATINNGLGNVALGGTVEVADGTYTENVALNQAATVNGTGNITLSGSLTITTGVWTSTAGVFSITGNFTRNGGTFNHNNGTFVLNGAAAQTIGGSASTAFNNLILSNAAGANLGIDETIGGALSLTNGILSTGTTTLTLTPTATTSRDGGCAITTCFVTSGTGGGFKKQFSGAATPSFIFPVGTSGGTDNGYSPVTLVNATPTGTGELTVRAVDSASPAAIATPKITRYWALTGLNLTADISFKYLDGDLTGIDETKLRVYKETANQCASDCVNDATNTGTVTGVNSFSNWTLAEAATLPPTAAEATISGRVVSSSGRGIFKVTVMLSGGNLTEPRYAVTNYFGYYQFTDVQAGQDYIVTPESSRYRFTPNAKLQSLTEDSTNVNFIANLQSP